MKEVVRATEQVCTQVARWEQVCFLLPFILSEGGMSMNEKAFV